jgi:hypothetical protein
MPYSIQVIHTDDFLRFAGNKKDVDLAETHRVLSAIARQCIDRGIDCALLDVRQMTGDLSPTDMYQLALAFHEMGFHKHHRLAILHRSAAGQRVEFFGMRPGALAEFFALCASQEGWNVRAFDKYEEAIEWFGAALPIAPGRNE